MLSSCIMTSYCVVIRIKSKVINCVCLLSLTFYSRSTCTPFWNQYFRKYSVQYIHVQAIMFLAKQGQVCRGQTCIQNILINVMLAISVLWFEVKWSELQTEIHQDFQPISWYIPMHHIHSMTPGIFGEQHCIRSPKQHSTSKFINCVIMVMFWGILL